MNTPRGGIFQARADRMHLQSASGVRAGRASPWRAQSVHDMLIESVRRKNGLKGDPVCLSVPPSVRSSPQFFLLNLLKRPSVSLSLSLFSLHPFKLSSRPDGRGKGRKEGREERRGEEGEYVHFLYENGRSPSPSLSSSARPSVPQIFLALARRLPSTLSISCPPSLLPPPSFPRPSSPRRRCCHHISWPQKGICSRERIRPPSVCLPPSVSLSTCGGDREKRKELEEEEEEGGAERERASPRSSRARHPRFLIGDLSSSSDDDDDDDDIVTI